MRNLLIVAYLKIHALFTEIISFVRIISFCYYIYHNRLVQNGNPIDILRVIRKYIEIASFNYSDSIVMSRTTQESTNLINTLIGVYLQNKSPVVLKQITEVLSKEFIERERNGSK